MARSRGLGDVYKRQDLPQMIIGLDYADAVERCEDYAYGILTSLAEAQEGKAE
jgi:hypothetical protein